MTFGPGGRRGGSHRLAGRDAAPADDEDDKAALIPHTLRPFSSYPSLKVVSAMLVTSVGIWSEIPNKQMNKWTNIRSAKSNNTHPLSVIALEYYLFWFSAVGSTICFCVGSRSIGCRQRGVFLFWPPAYGAGSWQIMRKDQMNVIINAWSSLASLMQPLTPPYPMESVWKMRSFFLSSYTWSHPRIDPGFCAAVCLF